jgi:purine-binding chemotaxis protein CheW
MDILKIRKKAKELQQKKEKAIDRDMDISTASEFVQKAEPQTVVKESIIQTDATPAPVLPGEEKQKTAEPIQSVQTEFSEQISTQQAEELATTDEFLDENKIVLEIPQIEVLEFVLGDEEYGIQLEDVREIIRMKPITEVPRTPLFVKGILSLRGTMIPVIDLKMRLKLGETQISQHTRIVIISDDTRHLGVIVDRINGVVKIREDMIEPTPPTISADVAEFIKGLGKYGEKIVRLLDLHKLSMFEIGSV